MVEKVDNIFNTKNIEIKGPSDPKIHIILSLTSPHISIYHNLPWLLIKYLQKFMTNTVNISKEYHNSYQI